MLTFKQHNVIVEESNKQQLHEELLDLGYDPYDENYFIEINEATKTNDYIPTPLFNKIIGKTDKRWMVKSEPFKDGFEGGFQIMNSGKKTSKIKLFLSNIVDRTTAANDYAKAMKLNKDFKSVDIKSGSAGSAIPEVVITLDDGYKVTILFKTDPKSKTSISAAVATQRGEAYAGLCIVAYSMNKSTNFSDTDLKKAYDKCDIKLPFEDVLINSKSWLSAGKQTASSVVQLFNGISLSASHDKGIVNTIGTLFKKVKGSFTGNLNKWNPADIWVYESSKKSFIESQLKSAIDLVSLNIVIQDLYDNNILRGISLKQVDHKPKLKVYNHTDLSSASMVTSATGVYAKKSFFNSADVFVFYDQGDISGSIQFRSFGEWQGEIIVTGSKARHGKVGGGPINDILKENNCVTLPSIKQAVAMIQQDEDGFLLQFFNYAKGADDIKGMNFAQFKEALFESPLTTKAVNQQAIYTRWAGKYIGCMLLDSFAPHKERITDSILKYASSSLPLSSVFVKTV